MTEHIFLHFKNGENEWGFRVPSGFIPCVGDTVQLSYGFPDSEGDELVGALITKRTWWLSELKIEFRIELEHPIPEGYVEDSTEWPSTEWSKEELAERRIRAGKSL